MRRRLMLSLTLLGSMLATPTLVSAQGATPDDAARRKAAETITADDIRRHVGVIAHDSMMGRATPSRGLELTARYVAEQFKAAGLRGGGDRGTWLQRIPAPDTIGTANAVGILDGTDPKLKNEYIVIVAHMDHIGVGAGNGMEDMRGGAPQPAGDTIYNGADDNASGTTGLIELAKAFAQPGMRPRRSVIFVGVIGEEGGSPSGTGYFLDHPPVPLEQFAAAFNMDMIGRFQAQNMLYIKGGQYSDLLESVGRVVPAHPELHLSVALRTDETEGSDHAAFAARKVPILFFYDGGAGEMAHPDYHRATDSPDKIMADVEANVLRLMFYVGQDVGNADRRPKWNEENWQNRSQNPDGNPMP